MSGWNKQSVGCYSDNSHLTAHGLVSKINNSTFKNKEQKGKYFEMDSMAEWEGSNQ